jgi:hypothetical protein
MNGPYTPAMRCLLSAKAAKLRAATPNKLFRSIYSFISTDFGVEPARCKDLCMHLRGAAVYTQPGWTCLLGVQQRDAAIKQ